MELFARTVRKREGRRAADAERFVERIAVAAAAVVGTAESTNADEAAILCFFVNA